jgi:hypothetical protein
MHAQTEIHCRLQARDNAAPAVVCDAATTCVYNNLTGVLSDAVCQQPNGRCLQVWCLGGGEFVKRVTL